MIGASRRWQNRITRHADVDPSTLVANPSNWRRHADAQRRAMAGALDQLGWLDELLVNERTGHVVNGHMRLALALDRAEPSVPVTYVDLSDDEERLALATYDPLGALGEAEGERLRALLDDLSTDDDALSSLLASLAESVTPVLPTPHAQTEPTLASECLIEIRCSARDLDDFADTLTEWEMRDGVSIDIS